MSDHPLPAQESKRQGGEQKNVEGQTAQHPQQGPPPQIGRVDPFQMRAHLGMGAGDGGLINATRQLGMGGQRLCLSDDLPLRPDPRRQASPGPAQPILKATVF